MSKSQKESTNIYDYYNSQGWAKDTKGVADDTNAFEDLRSCARKYNSKTRLRLLKFMPKKGEHFLDFASGPIQFPEYMAYSRNYTYRHCVDFSKQAIAQAKRKLGKRGKYYNKDIMDVDFKKDFFDCVMSMHTIYHIPS